MTNNIRKNAAAEAGRRMFAADSEPAPPAAPSQRFFPPPDPLPQPTPGVPQIPAGARGEREQPLEDFVRAGVTAAINKTGPVHQQPLPEGNPS